MSNGTGSVYQRKDGYWVAAVVLSGTRIVKYGKSKREARERLHALVAAQHHGTLVLPSRITVGEWLERWLVLIEPERRPSTVHGYRELARTIQHYLGTVRLDRLDAAGAAGAFVAMRRDGRGTSVVKSAFVVLHTSLARAVRLGILGQNPLDRLEPPAHVPRERVLWREEEVQRFVLITRASSHHYAPLFLFLLSTGLRVGEALGLRWGDIRDVNGGSIASIERALVWAGGTATLVPPKTRAGRRSVTLPELATQALARLGRPGTSASYVFQSPRGSTPNLANLLRALRALCMRASVPRISIHGLRAVHTALIAAEGVDPHTVRRRLGHARIATTFDIYAYALRPDGLAAAAFDRVLSERHSDDDDGAAS